MVNDKYKILFDQYDLQVDYVKRGRGEMICGTDQGLYAFSKTHLSCDRIEEEYQWKEQLIQLGMPQIDQYIRNKENEFISLDKYYEPFVMRKTYRGNEGNINSIEDMGKAAQNLAYFHRVAKGIPPNSCQKKKRDMLLRQYEQHKRELKTIGKFIQNKKNKGVFEYLFLEEIEERMKELCKSLDGMRQLNYKNFGWCHGAYNHHKIIFTKQGVATVHFEHFYYGYPMVDVYYFLRKVLEKNEYQFRYGIAVLSEYHQINPLSKDDYVFLYLLFCYPEKFWRISNQYMNHKKYWVSPRYLNKLTEFVDLSKKREEFLEKYCQFYNVIYR